ncbi:MAG: hypothetical protein NVSMB1_18940 [Polyangiales bacterium]
MANYPPPPPGGAYSHPSPAAADSLSRQRMLDEWAQARRYSVQPSPDVRWYQAWAPFVFLPPVVRLGCEVRATFSEVSLWLVEAFEGNTLNQATGDDRRVVAFVTSPQLAYRAAVRSRFGAGFFGDVGKELHSLFGGASAGVRGPLGDAAFEERFECAMPTREEGNAALSLPLRHLLLQAQWRGVLEVRAGGLVCSFYDRPGFDPGTLDGTIHLTGEIYRAAINYPYPVTAPP